MIESKKMLNDLSDDVRSFLGETDSAVEVLDDAGEVRYVVYRRPTAEERSAALNRLAALQKKTRASMDKQGVTESDVSELLRSPTCQSNDSVK